MKKQRLEKLVIFPHQVSTGRGSLAGGQFEISLSPVPGLAYPVTFGLLPSKMLSRTDGRQTLIQSSFVLSLMIEQATHNFTRTVFRLSASWKATPAGMDCIITGSSVASCLWHASAYFLSPMDLGTSSLRVIKTANFGKSTWALLVMSRSISPKMTGCMDSACGPVSGITKE